MTFTVRKVLSKEEYADLKFKYLKAVEGASTNVYYDHIGKIGSVPVPHARRGQ